MWVLATWDITWLLSQLQKIFSFYEEKSELSRLNKKRKLKVSKELLEVLLYSLKFCKLTKGRYDITLGKNILHRKNKEKETSISCSYKDIEINKEKVTIKNSEALIDLGSVAKGYITDKLVEFLKDKGVKEGMVDSRGDIILFGKNKRKISIQHPRKKEESLCTIHVKDCGIATSGDYNQFAGSFKKSHILNQQNLASVTVVAPTLAEADIYATALFVLEKKEREKIIKKNKKIKVFTVDEYLKTKYYNNFEELLCK